MQTFPATVTTAGTHPDPYPFYARLIAERPFGLDEETGLWVAASAAAVTAVLSDPGCQVRPVAEPVPRGIIDTPAGEVFGRLVRMTDGATQAGVKKVVLDALGGIDVAGVRGLAAAGAREVLAGDGQPWEELQFSVPARVVAVLDGLDAGESTKAARLIGDFVRCIPASATPVDCAIAAEAAGRLLDLLGPQLRTDSGGLLGELVRAADRAGWSDPAPLLANSVGLLSQTYDATAGLIGNTLLALGREGRSGNMTAFVEEVARYDAPIQNTRRFTAEPFRFDGHRVPAGSTILLLLAAANRDSAVNPDPDAFLIDRPDATMFTFGLGAHRCPGQALAVAITTGIVDTLRDHGPFTVLCQTYRPSPNARIPVLRTG